MQRPSQPDDALSQFESLQELSRYLAPLLEFHKAAEEASQDDLRMYWDVRLVRGKDTPFTHVKGSTHLPGILTRKMRPLASSTIEVEVRNKINLPLVSMIQSVVECATLEELAAEGKRPNGPPDDPGGTLYDSERSVSSPTLQAP